METILMISKNMLRFRGKIGVIILSGLILAIEAIPVRSDTTGLLGRIPRQANALVVIDVPKVLNSPVAVREGWKEKAANSFAEGVLIIPPGTQRMVMAAMIDLSAMNTLWEVTVMETDRMPAMESVARGEGGFVDKLGDLKAAWSPTNAYFVELNFNLLGTVWPANRQFTMGWVRQSAKAAGMPGEAWWTSRIGKEDFACLIAFNLKDAASPLRALRRFQEGQFTALATRDVDIKALADLLASVQGLTLRLQAGDKLTGEGEIEFTQDTGILKDIGKPLLLEFLNKSGANLPDFETWQFDVQPNKLVFKGDLSSAGFKRILSLVQPPMPNLTGSPAAKPSAGSKELDPKAVASKRYFTALCGLLDSVGKDIGVGGMAKALNVATVWLGRDARKIEQLPVLNVDEDLLAWSTDITRKIAEIAQVFALGSSATETQKVAVTVERAESNNYNFSYSTNTGYGNVSGNRAQATLDDKKRQAVLQEREKAHIAAVQIWKEMTGKRPAMRQLLSKRYQIEF